MDIFKSSDILGTAAQVMEELELTLAGTAEADTSALLMSNTKGVIIASIERQKHYNS